ncbi:hypothetical protein SmJEL517_g05162 [Synchytrium microbalum]|uniref:Small ribosomal subunit protein mS41 n=1 Tax=Synchytrium microbalum TaxID=1806994 RepID=A0A507C217_9FUNG|nr:uncharacterized protein SmJEL517_g05162 [Synchytrium microbalum]TPX31543.1 hypothetical protein SmJEL517_g05162 [Synchytrium microbalum]
MFGGLISRLAIGATTRISSLPTQLRNPALIRPIQVSTTKKLTYASTEALKQGSQYKDLVSTKERNAFIPPPRGEWTDVKSFLAAIGRNAESAVDKFKDWNHFFTVSPTELPTLVSDVPLRKYILSWREWYKQGYNPYAIAVPVRRKKYLKIRAKVQLARLKKQGLA